MLIPSSVRSDAQIIEYRMGQASPTRVSSELLGIPLAKDSGLNLFNPLSTIAHQTSPSLAVTITLVTPDFAAALTNNAWLTFGFTVGGRVTDLDLTSLIFDGARVGKNSTTCSNPTPRDASKRPVS